MMKTKLLLAFIIINLVVPKSAYTQITEFKITASDGASLDGFGFSASISGDYAIVTAIWDDDNGNNSGSAYVFKRTGTSWAQESKLLASDGSEENIFGVSASISGDYIIVGASGNSNATGSAYVFKRTGTSWSQEAKLFASDGASFDFFGGSVSDLPPKSWNRYRVTHLVYFQLKGGRKMRPRKYTTEKIIIKLREAEVLISQGMDADEASRQIGVSRQTFYRWRKEFGGMRVDQARRLKVLQKENLRLKHIVADKELDIQILKETLSLESKNF